MIINTFKSGQDLFYMSKNYLVVQHIPVYWTKNSRTGPHALSRNPVPEILPIPFSKLPKMEHGCIYHETCKEQIEIASEAESYKFGIINIVPQKDTIAVRFHSSYEQSVPSNVIFEYDGMSIPRRTVPLQPLTLKLGQWGQIRYNGRDYISRNSMYRLYFKHVYNIGWFSDLNSRAFFAKKPNKTYSNLVDLW